MIGKHVDVKEMTKEQAFDFITNRCKSCEISLFVMVLIQNCVMQKLLI